MHQPFATLAHPSPPPRLGLTAPLTACGRRQVAAMPPRLSTEIDQVKNLFNAIPQKTPKEQAKLDKVNLK